MKQLFLFVGCLLSFLSSAQNINHIVEIKSKGSIYSDKTIGEPRLIKYSYENDLLSATDIYASSSYGVIPFAGPMPVIEFKPVTKFTYAYKNGIRSERILSTTPDNYIELGKEPLILTSRNRLFFTKDSLIDFRYDTIYYDRGGYYKYKITFRYTNNYSLKGYSINNTNGDYWNDYGITKDSTKNEEGAFIDYKYPRISTGTWYFDSIKIVNNKLQFIIKNNPVDSTFGKFYEKFTFGTNGHFLEYEYLQYDRKKVNSIVRNTTQNDANGRPIKQTRYETLPDKLGKPFNVKIDEYCTYAYEKKSGKSSSALITFRKGNFLFTDWANDTGIETEMILISEDMNVKYYGYFPFGQPYFNTSAIPKGKYYLVVFCRTIPSMAGYAGYDSMTFKIRPPERTLGNLIPVEF